MRGFELIMKKVLRFPDRRLRIKAGPVVEFDDALRSFTDEMLEIMYAEQGIGLSATQIDVHKSVFVMDLSAQRNKPVCIINPYIREASGCYVFEEGCLSIPFVRAKVKRAMTIRVGYMDLDGKLQEIVAEGLRAACMQHEMDHLSGKLFTDYLSSTVREKVFHVMKEMRKQKKSECRNKIPYDLS